jgi:branched-chain amino acid transport system ATP-binding protein
MNAVTQRTDGVPPRLRVEGVTVRFGGLCALEDVSFDVPAGRVVGVIGPNGAGKTTLFNVVCGFVRPATGTLQLDGRPLRPVPHRLAARGVARTLQGLGLFDGQTVLENVVTGATHRARTGFGSALLALPRADRDERELRARARELLAEFGLEDVADASPATLPYAVRKRAALARALMADPRLLLLDEPAGGLGQDDIEDLVRVIGSMPTRTGADCSVMLVEHHVDLVMRVCDELVVLDFGRVIARGTPEEIRRDERVAEAYLGADVEVGS